MEPSGTEPKAPSLSEQNRSVYTQHAREREAVRAATVEAKAHSATDLLALWKCRRDNPLYVYLAPWKRGTAMRILFFSGLILHLWLPLLIFYPSLRIRLALAIVMFPLGFLLPPLMFLCFATTRTGDELVELYLTRMSDSEVVLGSVIWGLLTGWASTVVLSIYIVIDLVLIGATINHIVAFFFWYFLPLTILPIKSLRLWLTTRWARWTILV
ncbi:hypothetical protein GC173_01520, partial [bacterium]|nr:hypothetical protein [bacterium]